MTKMATQLIQSNYVRLGVSIEKSHLPSRLQDVFGFVGFILPHGFLYHAVDERID